MFLFCHVQGGGRAVCRQLVFYNRQINAQSYYFSLVFFLIVIEAALDLVTSSKLKFVIFDEIYCEATSKDVILRNAFNT
jgi:hypothetical protein